MTVAQSLCYEGPWFPRLATSAFVQVLNDSGLLGGVDAGGVEGESLGFAFGALGWDFLIIEEEGDAGGIADFDNDLLRGANAGVGGRDESFLGARLAIGGDGDPGGFCRADGQAHRSGCVCRRFCGCGCRGLRACGSGIRRYGGLECANGHVAAEMGGADDFAVVFLGVIFGGRGFCGCGTCYG